MVVPRGYVRCANCNKRQRDQGIGATCEHCGCSPLPSYHYDESSSFYPVEEQVIRKPKLLRRTELPALPEMDKVETESRRT